MEKTQKFDYNSRSWYDPDDDNDSKDVIAVDSRADLPAHWQLSSKEPNLAKVDPPMIDAYKSRHPTRIDPLASEVSPYVQFGITVPDWLSYYTGMPAYLSVNVYITTNIHWTVDGSQQGPLLTLDLKKVMQFATVSDALLTRLNPQNIAVRIVGWGLLHTAQLPRVDVKCQARLVRTDLTKEAPRVDYHLILACGTSIVRTDEKPRGRVTNALRVEDSKTTWNLDVGLDDWDIV